MAGRLYQAGCLDRICPYALREREWVILLHAKKIQGNGRWGFFSVEKVIKHYQMRDKAIRQQIMKAFHRLFVKGFIRRHRLRGYFGVPRWDNMSAFKVTDRGAAFIERTLELTRGWIEIAMSASVRVVGTRSEIQTWPTALGVHESPYDIITNYNILTKDIGKVHVLTRHVHHFRTTGVTTKACEEFRYRHEWSRVNFERDNSGS